MYILEIYECSFCYETLIYYYNKINTIFHYNKVSPKNTSSIHNTYKQTEKNIIRVLFI